MAAAIFFVSGGPLVWGPSLFLCPQGGVGVWGFGFSEGVLRVWGCLGVYTKKPEHFCCSVLEPYYALGSPSRLLTGYISKKYSPYGTSGAHSPSL